MKLNLKLAAAAAIVLSFSLAQAQTDTAYYDLGRIKLKKSATQAIVIKGSQLEKYPFTNLADAINVWFYGAKSNSSVLTFVIDGVIMNDVNAISIFDIEEVALIQNAATQISGSTHDQQFVVIRTRKAQQSGVTASAQANLVKINKPFNYSGTEPLKSTSNVFHQYYLSANHAGNKLQAGISANYQHDVFPQYYTGTFNGKVNSIERVKLRGYADYHLFAGTTLRLNGNLTPQTYGIDTQTPGVNAQNSISEKLFNGEVGLNSNLAKGLNNQISFGYNRAKNDLTTRTQFLSNGYLSVNELYSNKQIQVLKEHLSYTINADDFTIEPALNFMYRMAKDTFNFSTVTNTSNQPPMVSRGSSSGKYFSTFLTPSVSFAYLNLAGLQGGFNYIFKEGGSRRNTANPFVSGYANVTGLLMPQSGVNLKVYGSYAKSQTVSDGFNALVNFNNTNYYYGTPYAYNAVFYGYYGSPDQSTYHAFSAGADIGFFKDVLVFRYNFDQRKYSYPVQIQLYNSGISSYYLFTPAVNYSAHRIGLDISLLKRNNFSWISSVNTNYIKLNSKFNQSVPGSTDYIQGGKEWTGGWANRVTYKKMSAGADVLYFINAPQSLNVTTVVPYNGKPFALQHLFVGYNFTTGNNKNLEVFANARNLFQDRRTSVTDQRYFIGLGVKAQL